MHGQGTRNSRTMNFLHFMRTYRANGSLSGLPHPSVSTSCARTVSLCAMLPRHYMSYGVRNCGASVAPMPSPGTFPLAKRGMASAANDGMGRADIRIFSDASRMESGLGSAAVLYCPGHPEMVLRIHFPASAHTLTSLDGEIIGLALALILLGHFLSRADAPKVCRVSIGCDNTSAIDFSRKRTSRTEVVLNSLMAQLKSSRPQVELSFHHVKGHSGIPGNERANAEARRVAQDETCSIAMRLPPSLQRMRG